MYFSTAAESLSGLQGEIEELSVAADGEYRSAYISLLLSRKTLHILRPRKSRDH
jgi:hypothetical protein